jgi:hypothetical protein
MKHKQEGFAHVGLIVILVIALISGAGWLVYKRSQDKNLANSQAQTDTRTQAEPNTTKTAPKEPDSAETLSSPEKIASADTKTYFIYGAPAGENNKSPRTIVVSLPGHGTTADDGYKAWKNHLDGTYALAEFGWWRGTGEKKTDYYDPPSVVEQVRAFLTGQGYKSSDTIILHGFSRGSANTYAVIAQDKLRGGPVFDAVISNAGKYQSDFPLASPELSDSKMTEVFGGMPWVLVCGGLDENPTRDGCPGMEETKTFLTKHGANVLALLTDPNKGHGAFHLSDLQLPKQALQLISAAVN